MDQERWRRIEDSVQRALDLKPAERARFLDEACAGDEALRREMETLLGHEPEAAGFLESPAVVRFAGRESSEDASLSAGQEIDHYRVESRIGTGGMGEVYSAEDRLLGRKVAIKLLPDSLADDPERVQRFWQEAHAASQLSHPNIITIFETRRVEGRQLLVTELVHGRTLRSLIQEAPLQLEQALDVAIQVASALDAAHQAAIVHRDVKPENVMLRPDGLVKVLDFGLAKLRRSSPENRSDPPKGWLDSAPGRAMGTAGYMSPEQIRGLHVDHRSDLFSLGVLLFEMVDGGRPFTGATDADALAAVLQSEPRALGALAPGPRAALQRLVSRALEKDCERRYQSAAEMLDDLKSLKRSLGVELSASGPEIKLAGPWRGTAPARARNRPHRFEVSRPVVVALGVAAAVGAALAWRSWGPTPEEGRTSDPRITRVVATGRVQEAAISPDGEHLAYTTRANGMRSLWLHSLKTSDDVAVVPAGAGHACRWPQFSPDGGTLYYVTRDEHRGVNTLYRVPVTGGAPHRLLDQVDGPITLSPDGGRFAFVREERAGKETTLLAASIDGGAISRLAARREPIRIPAARPAWSPDGSLVAFASGTLGTEDDHAILAVPAEGGDERVLSTHRWRRLRDLVWLPDDSGMVLLAGDGYLQGNQHHVWQLRFRGDERRQLTDGSFNNESLSVTADGSELVTVQEDEIRGLWVSSFEQPNDARRLLTGGQAGRWGVTWSSGGEILYAGGPRGNQQIWTVDADGGNARRLTSGGDDDGPSVSPDGRFLLYASRRAPSSVCNIWRLQRDSGQLKQLTFGALDVDPVASPAGRFFVYVSWNDTASATILKLPLDGGVPVQLAAGITTNPSPALSPDGRSLAYYRDVRGDRNDRKKRIEIVSMEGGPPRQAFEMSESDYLVRWTPDGNALVYARVEQDVATNLWRLELRSGSRRKLTDYTSDVITRFAISPDGRRLGFSRSTVNRDIIRITGLR